MTSMQTGTLAEFVYDEQIALWTELEAAIRQAANGYWSMQAGWVGQRIVKAARLIGPSPIGEIPWTLSAGGVYEELMAIAGVPVENRSPAQWRADETLMVGQGHMPSREACRLQMSQTIAAMTDPREARFLRDED